MNNMTTEMLILLASLSSLLSKRIYREMHCLLLFGEPDFTEIEADLFSN